MNPIDVNIKNAIDALNLTPICFSQTDSSSYSKILSVLSQDLTVIHGYEKKNTSIPKVRPILEPIPRQQAELLLIESSLYEFISSLRESLALYLNTDYTYLLNNQSNILYDIETNDENDNTQSNTIEFNFVLNSSYQPNDLQFPLMNWFKQKGLPITSYTMTRPRVKFEEKEIFKPLTTISSESSNDYSSSYLHSGPGIFDESYNNSRLGNSASNSYFTENANLLSKFKSDQIHLGPTPSYTFEKSCLIVSINKATTPINLYFTTNTQHLNSNNCINVTSYLRETKSNIKNDLLFLNQFEQQKLQSVLDLNDEALLTVEDSISPMVSPNTKEIDSHILTISNKMIATDIRVEKTTKILTQKLNQVRTIAFTTALKELFVDLLNEHKSIKSAELFTAICKKIPVQAIEDITKGYYSSISNDILNGLTLSSEQINANIMYAEISKVILSSKKTIGLLSSSEIDGSSSTFFEFVHIFLTSKKPVEKLFLFNLLNDSLSKISSKISEMTPANQSEWINTLVELLQLSISRIDLKHQEEIRRLTVSGLSQQSIINLTLKTLHNIISAQQIEKNGLIKAELKLIVTSIFQNSPESLWDTIFDLFNNIKEKDIYVFDACFIESLTPEHYLNNRELIKNFDLQRKLSYFKKVIKQISQEHVEFNNILFDGFTAITASDLLQAQKKTLFSEVYPADLMELLPELKLKVNLVLNPTKDSLNISVGNLLVDAKHEIALLDNEKNYSSLKEIILNSLHKLSAKKREKHIPTLLQLIKNERNTLGLFSPGVVSRVDANETHYYQYSSELIDLEICLRAMLPNQFSDTAIYFINCSANHSLKLKEFKSSFTTLLTKSLSLTHKDTREFLLESDSSKLLESQRLYVKILKSKSISRGVHERKLERIERKIAVR